MLMPLQPPEVWDRLNEELRTKLGYKSDNPIRVYPNLYSAVEEVTTQLASFLAHKRGFTWIKGLSPTFEAPLAGFLREGYQVQSVDWKVHSQFVGQEEQWVAALPQDTLYVLAFEDHAVTGLKMNLDNFEKALAAKKIFFIRVSHFGLPSNSIELSPYSIFIGPTGFNTLAAAVCGARFRAPERGIPYHPWKAMELKNRTTLSENKAVVEKVEKQFPDNLWFSDSDSRRFDRVVLCFEDLAGDQIIKRLSEKLKTPLGFDQAQSTHACIWESIKLFKSWWAPQPRPEQFRGLVVISVDIAQRDDFAAVLKDTISELRSQSLFS